MLRLALIALLIPLQTPLGCGLPRDPEDTLESVRGEVLRVGVLEGSPLATAEGGGVEMELVRQLASRVDAQVEVHRGSVDELHSALERFELDLLVGGIERGSALTLKQRVGVSLHYAKARVQRDGETKTVRRVFLVPPGENGWLREVDRLLVASRPWAERRLGR